MTDKNDKKRELKMSRRGLLSGAPIAAASIALLPAAGVMAASASGQDATAEFGGISVGDIRISVISDGALPQGDPVGVLRGKDPEAIRAVLRDELLSDKEMTLDQNAVLIRSGGRLALVDTGTGGDSLFGDRPGKLMANLRAAGIDPAAITDVLLTHGHPDHMWGLTDLSGAVNFPNAQVHLSEADYAFFADPANDAHPKLGPFMAKCRAKLEAVKARFSMIKDEQEAIPGVVVMAAPGHTPGHSLYRVQSGKDTLVLGGDLAHHHAIFTRFPEVRFAFDTDPAQMVETRKRYFDMIATDRIRLLAYHFPFPGAGHLARSGGAYRWVPLSLDSI